VLSPVNTRGQTILAFNQPPRLTQPGEPSVGRRNEYRRWSRPLLVKKQQVLCKSRPCYYDCWHTDLVSYWALAIKWANYLANVGSYASLTGFNPHALSVNNRMSFHTTDVHIYVKSSSIQACNIISSETR